MDTSFFSKSVAITLANALVSSRLDYCNSLLYGIIVLEPQSFQGIQNNLCRIITRTRTSHLKDLHWLSVKYHIESKLYLIHYKTMVYGRPLYCVLLLYHIDLLLVQGWVTCPINYWQLMILITGFTNIKSTLILAVLWLVPSCGNHYSWVVDQQTL